MLPPKICAGFISPAPAALPYLCLSIIAAALGFQLLVPPIVGLADNGDFQREIGVFGYAPLTPKLTWAYVAHTYTRQEGSRRPGYQQFTSDYLFIALAIWIGKWIPGDETLPITLVGALHAAGLVAALARLFLVTRRFRGHLMLWLGTGAVLTDVGYAAYANSFFAEAASGVFAVWVVAEAVELCRTRANDLLFGTASLLLICAKPQNAPLAMPLAAFAILVSHRSPILTRVISATAILAAGVWIFLSVQPRPRLETSYNLLFAAVLPESRDPRGDLRALRLDPELVRLKGTMAWSPNSGLYEAGVRDAMRAAGPQQVAAFYLQRPTRAWRHITTLLPFATQLRPESCGNFEPDSGRPPAARATQFSLWSTIHAQWLGRVAKFLLFGLILMAATGAILRRRSTWAPLITLLPVLALTAFLTAAFGDANEPIKHQYLFNLMLDACILFVLTGVTGVIRS